MTDGIRRPNMLRRALGAELTGPMLGLLFVLGLSFSVLAANGRLGTFLTLTNLQVLAHNNAVAAIAALGMLLVIISGGIDLSVGAIVALVTVMTMKAYNALDAFTGSHVMIEAEAAGVLLPFYPVEAAVAVGAVLIGLLVGAVIGMVNGLLVTGLRVPPFLATLGMLGVARGLAFWQSERQRFTFSGGSPEWVKDTATALTDTMLFSPGVWAFLLLAIIVAIVLRYTVFGRYIYAIGSSEPTARLCGIPVGRTRLTVYVLAGLFAGTAGLLRFAHTSSGDPNTGDGLELEVIAAVVLGGASLTGGRGTVAGTVIGVVILGVLVNFVHIVQVAVEVKYVLIGSVVILNTALSQWQQRRGQE